MRTVLFIERDRSLRSAVCDLLTPHGVRIVCVRGPGEATRWLEEEPRRPRLIVMDLHSSGVEEGLQLLDWLRAHPRLATTRVLVLCDGCASGGELLARGVVGVVPCDVPEWRLVELIDRFASDAGPVVPGRRSQR